MSEIVRGTPKQIDWAKRIKEKHGTNFQNLVIEMTSEGLTVNQKAKILELIERAYLDADFWIWLHYNLGMEPEAIRTIAFLVLDPEQVSYCGDIPYQPWFKRIRDETAVF